MAMKKRINRMIKVRADLNALTIDRSRVQLSGSLPPELEPDLQVLLYEPDEFEVGAIIEKVNIDDGTEIWYGIINWDTYRDL
jgi:hypothetical protein